MKPFVRPACFLLAAILAAGCGTAPALPVSALADSREVTILMYHSVLRDPARTGDYVVTPEALEGDLRWLMENGYETVSLSALRAYAEGRGDLPEQPVVLTFDDGYLNNLTYVLPLLTELDCCAAVSVVGTYAERFSETPDPNPNYAHVTWDDITALALSGRVEIVNHSYDMHSLTTRRGSARKKGESAEAYAAAFTGDVDRLQTALAARCSVTPDFFAYPFGAVGEGSRALLADMGFSGSLTCREAVNRVVVGAPDTLFGLGRYNRPGKMTTEAFMKKVFDSG